MHTWVVHIPWGTVIDVAAPRVLVDADDVGPGVCATEPLQSPRCSGPPQYCGYLSKVLDVR